MLFDSCVAKTAALLLATTALLVVSPQQVAGGSVGMSAEHVIEVAPHAGRGLRSAVTASTVLNGSMPDVTGQGRVDIGTTLTRMKLIIVRKSKCDPDKEDECSAGDLQLKINDVVAALVRNITERDGVEGIATQGMTLEPEYSSIPVPPKATNCPKCYTTDEFGNKTEIAPPEQYRTALVGYRAQANIVAVVPTVIVGDVLDSATALGVNSIRNVEYYVSDAQIQAAKLKALRMATQNALRQADSVLDVVNEVALQAQEIEIPFFGSPPFENNNVNLGEDAVMQTIDDEGNIVGGIRTVAYKVTLSLKF